MATNFPVSLQDLDSTRGTANQALNSPSHVAHHLIEDDTLEALQAKVGIDSSAVTTTLDYKLTNTTAGHDHDGTDSKKVIATNLDITGITSLQLVRVNTGATALEGLTAPGGSLVGTTATQTLTNKTLTAPVIATIVNTGTLTLPTSTDTLVGRATTDTLTNKTLTAPVIATIVNTGTLTLPTSTDTLVGRATTDTLSNKRRTLRVYSAANNASLTPEIDTYDVFHLTAMSAATTINNHSTSTPTDGEMMILRFLDNATARALTWGTAYVAKAGTALPTTTTLSKNLSCLFQYNSNLAKWNLLASGVEA